MYIENDELFTFTKIGKRKRFFRGTLANFCKSKKCIIFNVDYRPGYKKSKFDMTLIRHSLFKINKILKKVHMLLETLFAPVFGVIFVSTRFLDRQRFFSTL